MNHFDDRQSYFMWLRCQRQFMKMQDNNNQQDVSCSAYGGQEKKAYTLTDFQSDLWYNSKHVMTPLQQCLMWKIRVLATKYKLTYLMMQLRYNMQNQQTKQKGKPSREYRKAREQKRSH